MSRCKIDLPARPAGLVDAKWVVGLSEGTKAKAVSIIIDTVAITPIVIDARMIDCDCLFL